MVPDAVANDLHDAGTVAGLSSKPTTIHPNQTHDQQSIALIKPCGHILHDECLRQWAQKANSCPICRHIFNQVEVLDKVGGRFPIASHSTLLWHICDFSSAAIKTLRLLRDSASFDNHQDGLCTSVYKTC